MKPKHSSTKYKDTIAAARKAGGETSQANWWSRLKTVVKLRTVSAKKAKADR